MSGSGALNRDGDAKDPDDLLRTMTIESYVLETESPRYSAPKRQCSAATWCCDLSPIPARFTSMSLIARKTASPEAKGSRLACHRYQKPTWGRQTPLERQTPVQLDLSTSLVFLFVLRVPIPFCTRYSAFITTKQSRQPNHPLERGTVVLSEPTPSPVTKRPAWTEFFLTVQA